MTIKVTTERFWKLRSRKLDVSARVNVMAILNMTPDSFSDGGRHGTKDDALRMAEGFVSDGATIVDVGGESTRPGSMRVGTAQEIDRVVPVIEAIVGNLDIAVSVDTSKASVAKAAVDAGAEIVNDISGMRFDHDMGRVAADSGAAMILMHSEGDFDSLHLKSADADIGKTVVAGLRKSLYAAIESGVVRNRICLDIGIGFGKTMEQNLELLRRLRDISDCFPGIPMMVGASRKSFIGSITNEDIPENRLPGTIAANCAAVLNGADIIRVHDVKAAVDSIKVLDAIRGIR